MSNRKYFSDVSIDSEKTRHRGIFRRMELAAYGEGGCFVAKLKGRYALRCKVFIFGELIAFVALLHV